MIHYSDDQPEPEPKSEEKPKPKMKETMLWFSPKREEPLPIEIAAELIAAVMALFVLCILILVLFVSML